MLRHLFWTEKDFYTFNYRLRSINTTFLSAITAKSSDALIILRRLYKMIGDLIDIMERGDRAIEVKVLFADHLADELFASGLNEKKLMTQLYLLDPDWLSNQICQRLLRKKVEVPTGTS